MDDTINVFYRRLFVSDFYDAERGISNAVLADDDVSEKGVQ